MTDDDGIDRERRADLEATFKHLTENVSVDELDRQSGLHFGDRPDWCQWVAETTENGLERPECEKLHARIRKWIHDERKRATRRT